MGTCCETICKHRILFPSIQHLAWLPQGRPQGKQKCCKIEIFGVTHWLKHHITQKLLKIDRYMLRAVWQALNCLSIHVTKMLHGWKLWAASIVSVVRENGDFCRAMRCIWASISISISAAYVGMQCLCVCPSVTFVSCVKTNKHIFEIFSHRVAKPF